MEATKSTQASGSPETSIARSISSTTSNTPIIQTSFQHLPPELRCLVYTEISPPLRCHMDYYYSMMWACKWLKAESEGEIAKYMQTYLERITKAWDETHTSPLRIKTPKTFWGIKNIKISLPTSILLNKRICSTIPRAFLPLFDLHLSSLTFTFHEDEPKKSMAYAHYMYDFLKRISELLQPNKGLPLDDGTTYFKQGPIEIDTVAVVLPHGFNDMWCIAVPFSSSCVTREFIMPVVDTTVDGGVRPGLAKKRFLFDPPALGVTWHGIDGKIPRHDGSTKKLLYNCLLPCH
ncbi:hypothetical protein P3342_008688 [Pyrenophora teres f. teres]|uniref:Uncharacterized protein n=1 Tax=Pyrenophora teres f. teres TaxID=97479 RepID=A0A6S6W9P5_9PLEO|nr:hypothetical protein PTNB29_08267 [Pyrenophora teres f. teres]KAK1910808.1 hypothetical protein P3342_008688 [Pyrenophora teres f. teres]CAA9963157.1 hypothetical protein PTMSG1_06525 [Pyrenophora teres f. maculata]CAE7187188.1 hypothetical protein PTTW11_07102 [Pyrenophora teres f. teres]